MEDGPLPPVNSSSNGISTVDWRAREKRMLTRHTRHEPYPDVLKITRWLAHCEADLASQDGKDKGFEQNTWDHFSV